MSDVNTLLRDRAVQFKVDAETCIQCGLCAKDCPMAIIDTESEVLPQLVDEAACIRCQHCFAVCPTASLSLLGKDPGEAGDLKNNLPSGDQLITLIKGRRSVRQYKDENLPGELIEVMLETVWHAPTGQNSQQNMITVIDDKDAVAALRDEIYTKVKTALQNGELADHPAGEYLAMAVDIRETSGVDIIFRGAPHVLLITSPESSPSPVQDTNIALAAFDLLAPAMGVGTLWNGMLKWSLGLFPELLEKLDIPEDHHLGYAMVFGKPAVHYQRTAERGPASINKISHWQT